MVVNLGPWGRDQDAVDPAERRIAGDAGLDLLEYSAEEFTITWIDLIHMEQIDPKPPGGNRVHDILAARISDDPLPPQFCLTLGTHLHERIHLAGILLDQLSKVRAAEQRILVQTMLEA